MPARLQHKPLVRLPRYVPDDDPAPAPQGGLWPLGFAAWVVLVGLSASSQSLAVSVGDWLQRKPMLQAAASPHGPPVQTLESPPVRAPARIAGDVARVTGRITAAPVAAPANLAQIPIETPSEPQNAAADHDSERIAPAPSPLETTPPSRTTPPGPFASPLETTPPSRTTPPGPLETTPPSRTTPRAVEARSPSPLETTPVEPAAIPTDRIALNELFALGPRSGSQANPALGATRRESTESSPSETMRSKSPKSTVAAPSPRMSCAQARASIADEIHMGKSSAADIPRERYASLLNDGQYFSHCGVPASTGVDICVAVQRAHAVGITVTTSPRNGKLEACVASAVAAIRFPHHPKLDVINTRFR